MNSARVILERFVYLFFLVLTTGSIVTMGISLMLLYERLGLPWSVVGLLGVLFARCLFVYGREHLHFDDWERAWESSPLDASFFPPDQARAERIEQMRLALSELDALEAMRRLGRPNVWKIQHARSRVQALLQEDPRLSNDFSSELTSRPEIRID
jgi:hypothetical protein